MTKKLEDLLNIADDKPSQKSASKAETAITDQFQASQKWLKWLFRAS